MFLTAVITKDELVALVRGFLPLRIDIDPERGRVVMLGPARTIDLVPGKGLRVRGDARIAWDIAGVAIPVTIQGWQLLLAPRILTRGKAAQARQQLVFTPELEALDLKLVPGFLDQKIAGAIRGVIAQNRERLAWDFARTLSKRLPLPAKVGPPGLFEIRAMEGTVTVTEAEVRLAVRFEAGVEARASATAQAGEPVARTVPLTTARAAAR